MLKKIVIFLCILFLSPLSLAQDEITNILLIGTDDLLEQVTTEKKMGRADAIYLVSINSSKATIKLLGIERDYLVDLGEHGGKNKLATSTYFGGANGCLQAVNNLLSLQIDHYLQIDIPGVLKSFDLIDGLQVDLTKDEAELLKTYVDPSPNGSVLKAGANQLTGEMMHAYLRMRDESIDYVVSNVQRNERHRKAISYLLQKLKSLSTDKMLGIVENALQYISTNLSASDLLTILTYVQENATSMLEYKRTPMTEFTRKREGFHQVIVCNNLQKEQEEIKNFLFR